ncbi:MAG: phosphatidate cytidylyltransferase [Acidobacteria bacterium]|nr:phosphatidate cytidylyltransferase [Acidobacteriota bacterium]
MKRIVTAAFLIAVVFPTVRLLWLPAFWAVLLGVVLIAAMELRELLTRLDRPPWPGLAVGGALATTLCFAFDPNPLVPVLAGFVVLVLGRAALSRRTPAQRVDRITATLFPAVYLGVTIGHAGGLLMLPVRSNVDRGDMLILLMAAVYVGDTTALVGGKLLGRHQLAPLTSPRKTWEGAICGVLGAIGASLLAPAWFAQDLPVRHAITIGLLLGVAGILGDLVESILKRAAGVKDSGELLPGHGGMLDRIDSLLLAAPTLYWYQRLILAP